MSPENPPSAPLRLLIVDDDEVSRDVMTMLAEAEGYAAAAVESGEEALAWVAENQADAVLSDVQMPGISGDALANALRNVCGSETALLAMSGSQPKLEVTRSFDAFLLKPFSMEDLGAAIANRKRATEPVASTAAPLDAATHARLARTMKPEQVKALFAMFFGDTEKRLATMRSAAVAGDDSQFRAAAHAIKGGCGMVGAAELHGLASELEETGIGSSSLDSLAGFALAMERLRRILDAL
jgi:CheY-like chemotaxis protein/HPt (histidine-containing phosphotransfer) domain-containing protein